METKPWYQSKTIWGSVVAFVSTLGGVFGISLSGAEQTVLIEGLSAAGGLVALVLTVYGRLTAKTGIGGSGAGVAGQ